MMLSEILLLAAWAAQPAPSAVAEGRRYYMGHCAHCHGPDGEGAGGGANLTTGSFRLGGADADLLRTIRNGIPGTEMSGSRLSDAEIGKVIAFIRSLAQAGASGKAGGDPNNGAAIYNGKGACAQCHAIGGSGGSLGPELDTIGRRRSLRYLRDSLVTPDAHVPGGYQAFSLVQRSGERITGIRLNEDDDSIQLRDAGENLRSFRKANLAEMKPAASLMPAYGKTLSPREIEDLVSYLSSLVGRSSARAPASAGPGTSKVTFERIVNAAREPGNWLTYSGNYQGWRHSPLTEINVENVNRLRPRWVYQFRTTHKVETSPIVVDGVMYLTRPPNEVIALDAATGRRFWSYEHKLPADVHVCCGQVNRGLAILDHRLFMTTVDARVIALDARSGRLLWNVEQADYRQGYAGTVAPLAVRDKVIAGIAGGEYGIGGFVDAYDAATGKRAWRFHTIPGPGEPNFGTWQGDSWKTGGAPTWVTGSYDPELNLTYWGTGNPGPDWNGDGRAGDNLYSDSMLALDVSTGKLRWFFQYTPHDEHDWDATQVPVLADLDFRGRRRKLLLHANRNAFFYLLDRESGEFLSATPYVNQTWAKEIDARGRPVRLPNTFPTIEGTAVWPGVDGGTNWYSPSYSPVTGLLYVALQEQPHLFFKADADYRPGLYFAGGSYTPVPGVAGYGAVRAIHPPTGEIRWEHRVLTPGWAGVLSTAGNLVFGGTEEGNFFALDARTGRQLWSFPTGGRIIANPVSFTAEGKQYVAIAAGDLLLAFGLD